MAKSSFWADFKAFAMKGNVIDMAVGVVVGGAFGKIVASLVNDIIMPLVGWLIGGIDFTKLSVELKGTLASNAAKAAGQAVETVQGVMLNYGNFIQEIVNFIIIALSIFLVIRAITRSARKKAEAEAAAAAAAPAPKSEDVVLLEEIRDLLKKNAGK